MKPILFNTEMVERVMSGDKTVTRRLVKPQPEFRFLETGTPEPLDDGTWCFKIDQYENIYEHNLEPKYQKGDVLYVRETWRIQKAHRYEADALIQYRAGGPGKFLRFKNGNTDSANRDEFDTFINKWGVDWKWHPSIHMPKELARTYLLVTDVKLERLQNMTQQDAIKEGCYEKQDPNGKFSSSPLLMFYKIWNGTMSVKEWEKYGWEANPWVWAYSFKVITQEEAEMYDSKM